MTLENWLPVLSVGVALYALIRRDLSSVQESVAALRERIAKLEGVLEATLSPPAPGGTEVKEFPGWRKFR